MVDWEGVVAVAVVFATVLLSLGPIVVSFGFLSGYADEMTAQDRAVAVEGTVTDTEIIPVDDNVDEDDDTDYRPGVEYQYTYDGETQLSRNVRPVRQGEIGPFSTVETRRDAEDVLTEYRPDSTVTVYVDPEDEYRAYLVPRSRVINRNLWTAIVLFVAGVFVGQLQIRTFDAFQMNAFERLRALRGRA